MKTYEFYSLDIWGNDKEGYDINNIFNTGIFIMSDEFPPFSVLIRVLKKESILAKRYHFHSQYPYEDFEIIEYNGKPLFQVMENNNPDLNSQWYTEYPRRRNSIVYKWEKNRLYRYNDKKIYND